jgi:hypothetical protein
MSMVGPQGGADAGDSGAPTINIRNVDDSPQEVPELKIWERPPSTLRNIDSGPPGGVGAEDLGASTINAKKRRWRAP